MREIGIYGGTFSPPHSGHVRAAMAFYNQLALEKLFIVPASIPPHKLRDPLDSPQTRLEMTRLAFSDLPGFGNTIAVSDYEIAKSGISYTAQTLEHFRLLFPAGQNFRLNFLCGTDMFLTLDKWRMPETIFSLCRIAFMRREKRIPELDAQIQASIERYQNTFGADIVEITGGIVEVSSTELRVKIAQTQGAENGLIPQKVMDYIRQHRLYQQLI